MNSKRNILVAFILNLGFSIFELTGGFLTGSTAIISDAVHDLGDAVSIGFSCILEGKSRKKPNDVYTYGYMGYQVIGSMLTNGILVIGSVATIINAVSRILNPTDINYNGMLIFAVVGVLINGFAVYFTSNGGSLNEKAVNLHMLEDVLGWIVVLVGAIVMRLTDFVFIDAIMSIGVSLFILITALKNFVPIAEIILWKTPKGILVEEIKNKIMEIPEVLDVHHIHIWSCDGENNFATMHIVTETPEIKAKIRETLQYFKIEHITLEMENEAERCCSRFCEIKKHNHNHNHNHNHSHCEHHN